MHLAETPAASLASFQPATLNSASKKVAGHTMQHMDPAADHGHIARKCKCSSCFATFMFANNHDVQFTRFLLFAAL
jgi:hypothetical protein